jgi:parallel beta-helix repeat protein
VKTRRTHHLYLFKEVLCLCFLLSLTLPAQALTLTSDTTWTKAQSPIIVSDNLSVQSGAKLTIEAGVVVKVALGARLSFAQGRLGTLGTNAQPVIITSIRDDAADGIDSNGDGGATAPAPGDWGYILLHNPGFGDVLNNTYIRYAGRNLPGLPAAPAVSVQNAMPLIVGGGVSYTSGDAFSLSQSSPFLFGGLFITECGGSAIRVLGGQLNIQNCLITKCKRGVESLVAANVTVVGSSITDQVEYGVYTDGAQVQAINNWWGHSSGPLDDSDDRASGGFYNPTGQGSRVSDRVVYSPWLTGGRVNPFTPVIDANTVWHLSDSPVIVTENGYIRAGATLTIEPGVVVKFMPGTGLQVESGAILSQGTAGQRIIFTSIRDDAADGIDSNGDGAATLPQPGDWGSINIYPYPYASWRTEFDYAEFRYGGGAASTAMVESRFINLFINNSVFKKSSKTGLSFNFNGVPAELPRVENSTFTENRIGATASGNGLSIEFSGCEFSNNTSEGVASLDGGPAITLRNNRFLNNGSFGASIVGNSHGVTGNLFDGNHVGLFIGSSGETDLSGNTFRNSKPNGLYRGVPLVNHFGDELSELSPNTFDSSNEINAIQLFGAGATETNRPLIAFSIPYYIGNGGIGVGVNLGKKLVIGPGVVIKLDRSDFRVFGTLITEGTETKPVIFTSIHDDSVGGDTNGNGNATLPTPGDWLYADIGISSSSAVAYTEFRYGGGHPNQRAMVEIQNSDIPFQNVSFLYSASAGAEFGNGSGGPGGVEACVFSGNATVGALVGESSGARFSDCRFENEPYGISIYGSRTIVLKAENNWWGDASGPLDDSDDRATGGYYNPTGTGVRVADLVDYIPWIGMPEVVPPQVTGATVTYNNDGRTVQIGWTAVPDAANYSVLFSTDGVQFSQIGVSTASPATHQPPAGPERFTYAVAGLNQSGTAGPRSEAASISSPFRPVLVSPADQAVFFASTVVVQGSAQVGTRVIVRASSGTELGSVMTSVAGTYAVPLVLGEGTHQIAVFVRDAAGRESAETAPISIFINLPPSQPAAPTATPGDTVMTLSWVPSAASDTVGYWVYRDNSSLPLNSQLIPNAVLPQFVDLGLTNARSYSYRVAAQDAAGNIGPKSDAVSAKPVAGPEWGGVR